MGFRDLESRAAQVPQGTIRYRELGAGQPIVLVHGLLANGLLWEDVAPRLGELRVIVPDWPLGAHDTPLRPGTDLTPLGLAQIVADFLAALDLEDVTLVGNDTGGLICQVVAVEHPERLARLVLTPCDAYENCLPPLFRPLSTLAHVPGFVWLMANCLRPRPARRLPNTFGWLSKRPLAPEVSDAFLAPALRDAAIRRELAAILRSLTKGYALDAAARFGEFRKPVLILWAAEDRVFPWRYADRLALAFPDTRLERIADSYAFVSIDQPARTAELIAGFARERATTRARG